MSIRILEIVVYGHAGQHNSIRLNGSGLSIVTGASKTGKSSLIDIIEYCFGRETCNVADGVIRQHVSWYGILLDRSDTESLWPAGILDRPRREIQTFTSRWAMT